MRLSHLLVAAAVCLFWGLNAVAAKVGVTYMPPIFFTSLRFLALVVLLAPWLRIAPVRGQWRVLVPAVVFMGALHFALIFTGVKFATASAMAIINQLYVPFAVLIALFWLGEEVPVRRGVGIALAFTGVVLFSVDGDARVQWLGVALLVIDALVMAVGTVLLRRLRGISPFTMQAWMAMIGFPLLACMSLLIEGGQLEAARAAPPPAWAALAFTIVGGSLIGHTGYYYLLQRHDVSLVTSLLLVAPVIGVLSGIVLLGEPVSPFIVIGGAMTIGGVAVVLRRERVPVGSF